MNKVIYVSFGFLALITLIAIVGTWQMTKWQKTLSQSSLSSLKSISSEQFQELYSFSDTTYQEFINSDGKLKMKYPSDWLVIEDENLFITMTPKEWEKKYNFKTIFLAQYFKIDKFAQLIIHEGVFDISIEEIVEKMKESNQKQGLQMEIVKSDIKDSQGVFEVKYLIASGSNLYSKETIVSSEEKTYLIAFITFEKDWQEFAEKAEFILGSVQINP